MAVPRDRVIIIGAGIGGLVAAAGLAARGVDVTVLERAATLGGKLREIDIGGRAIDSGPTVFTMRSIFDEIFRDAGSSLERHLTLEPVDTLARHFWGAGPHLDLFADRQRSADAIARFAGPTEGRNYLEFCARAKQVFDTLERPFMHQEPPGMLSLVRGIGLRRLGGLRDISPFATLWQELGRYFKDPRLRQLFARYATYCGSSPFLAPATLMLIAHVEQEGVWIVQGGMYRIPLALADLATSHGARLRTHAEVVAINMTGGRACGVQLASGERLEADAVLMNGDIAALAEGRFGAGARGAVPRQDSRQRSLSALTWSMVAETADVALVRHTVFFSPDYSAEFDALSRSRTLPAAPTVYVCAQDRDHRGQLDAPGPERLFLIVNAPACGDAGAPRPSEIAACEKATFQTLETSGLKLVQRPGMSRMTGPEDFAKLFPGTGGALYGMASHGWQASFRRPGARSRIPGLYLAGGSVHPGPGVPMAALSGRMAVSRIVSDLASMRRSSRVAMAGGISTL